MENLISMILNNVRFKFSFNDVRMLVNLEKEKLQKDLSLLSLNKEFEFIPLELLENQEDYEDGDGKNTGISNQDHLRFLIKSNLHNNKTYFYIIKGTRNLKYDKNKTLEQLQPYHWFLVIQEKEQIIFLDSLGYEKIPQKMFDLFIKDKEQGIKYTRNRTKLQHNSCVCFMYAVELAFIEARLITFNKIFDKIINTIKPTIITKFLENKKPKSIVNEFADLLDPIEAINEEPFCDISKETKTISGRNKLLILNKNNILNSEKIYLSKLTTLQEYLMNVFDIIENIKEQIIPTPNEVNNTLLEIINLVLSNDIKDEFNIKNIVNLNDLTQNQFNILVEIKNSYLLNKEFGYNYHKEYICDKYNENIELYNNINIDKFFEAIEKVKTSQIFIDKLKKQNKMIFFAEKCEALPTLNFMYINTYLKSIELTIHKQKFLEEQTYNQFKLSLKLLKDAEKNLLQNQQELR